MFVQLRKRGKLVFPRPWHLLSDGEVRSRLDACGSGKFRVNKALEIMERPAGLSLHETGKGWRRKFWRLVSSLVAGFQNLSHFLSLGFKTMWKALTFASFTEAALLIKGPDWWPHSQETWGILFYHLVPFTVFHPERDQDLEWVGEGVPMWWEKNLSVTLSQPFKSATSLQAPIMHLKRRGVHGAEADIRGWRCGDHLFYLGCTPRLV